MKHMVLEDWERTLEVADELSRDELRALLPQIFEGVIDIWKGNDCNWACEVRIGVSKSCLADCSHESNDSVAAFSSN